jgi:hypothetical protein
VIGVRGVMNCRRRLISGTICALLFAGFVRADMTSVYQPQVDRLPSQSVSDRVEVRQADQSGLFDRPLIDFDLGPVELASENISETTPPASAPQQAIDLSGGPGSVGLCLYALMGLGLCSSPHWIKRLHFSHIPEWYHDGGPLQIGHSFAATPESLCTLWVYCLLPPNGSAGDLLSQFRQRTVISLWRRSLFASDVLTSRGPPNMP